MIGILGRGCYLSPCRNPQTPRTAHDHDRSLSPGFAPASFYFHTNPTTPTDGLQFYYAPAGTGPRRNHERLVMGSARIARTRSVPTHYVELDFVVLRPPAVTSNYRVMWRESGGARSRSQRGKSLRRRPRLTPNSLTPNSVPLGCFLTHV